MPEPFDTTNRFLVCVRGEMTFIPGTNLSLTRDEALSLVVWVSVLAGLKDPEILSARRAVESA